MSSSDAPVRTRYAPSPTGRPHIGNMRNAIYSWLLARRHGGQFIFRLEDTDRERYDAASELAQYEALKALGLDYDEGPDIGGPYAPYVQSQRLERYQAVAEELIASGSAYRCWCDRDRLARVREERQRRNIHPFGYDRHCRHLSREEQAQRAAAGGPSVVRFAIPEEGVTQFEDLARGTVTYPNAELDDHVLLKSDGFPTYHLACVVDDHDMRITHVIRSDEWLPSTPRHVLTYRALNWEIPQLVHPPLIQGRDAQSGKVAKLSKRHGAVYVGEYLQQGYLPEALVNFLVLLGWSPGGDREVMSRAEMIDLFDPTGVNPSPSLFDADKLLWMNGVYLRALDPQELLGRAIPYLAEAGLIDPEPDAEIRDYLLRVIGLEQERLKLLSELPDLARFFLEEPPQYDPAAVRKRLEKPEAGPLLARAVAGLQEIEDWSAASIEAAVRAAAEESAVKAAELIHPLRVAATGRMTGPGLFEALELLGRERTLKRIQSALQQFCSSTAREEKTSAPV